MIDLDTKVECEAMKPRAIYGRSLALADRPLVADARSTGSVKERTGPRKRRSSARACGRGAI